MDLSVITATCQRPEFLAHCIQQFQRQSRGGLRCEHVIVSDGVDPHARRLAEQSGARYCELQPPVGQWGAGAKDLGIKVARGKFVCFWDDDNLYDAHALVTLYAAAYPADLGVVRTVHHFRKRAGQVVIPRCWEGTFTLGDIDTMCVCVARTLARLEQWQSAHAKISNDHGWLMKLMQHNPVINYLPIVIGQHV